MKVDRHLQDTRAAWLAYKESTEQAQETYEARTAEAQRAYDEAEHVFDEAGRIFTETTRPHYIEYEKEVAEALRVYRCSVSEA